MSYQVGVDLGTTYSAAARCRDGGPVELVPLGQRARSVPSTVYVGPDGAFLIGEDAERRALSEPGRVVREFKRRIGDPTPVLVGHEPMPAEQLAARFVARLLQDMSRREGATPSRVALTHPAGWGQHKLRSLRGALAEHGLGSAVLLSEPQAAAVGYTNTERIEVGSTVAVYDLGGGTFDAAVVRKTAGGGFELLGTPEGIDQLGGVDFDEAVFAHVRGALGSDWGGLDPSDPEVLAAVAGLRRECTAAKEALSHDTEVLISVLLPGICTQVRLGRAEFEDMIRPAVAETVAALRRALGSAGVTAADLGALLLVGGSSRIPLITQAVAEEFGRSAAVDVDPKGVIASGAAVVARGAERANARPAAGSAPRATAAPPALAPAPAPAPAPPSPPSAVPTPAVMTPPTLRAVRPAPDATTAAVEGTGPLRPAPRPPKQARPFTAVVEQPDGRRRVGIGLAAGALVLVLLGGAVAFGATRLGATRDADASTPPTAVTSVSPAATAGEPTKPPISTAAEPPPQLVAPRTRPRTRPAPPPPAVTTTVPPPAAENGAGAAPGQGDAGDQQNGGQQDGNQLEPDPQNGDQQGADGNDGGGNDGGGNNGGGNNGDGNNGEGNNDVGTDDDRQRGAREDGSESAGAAGAVNLTGTGAADVRPAANQPTTTVTSTPTT